MAKIKNVQARLAGKRLSSLRANIFSPNSVLKWNLKNKKEYRQWVNFQEQVHGSAALKTYPLSRIWSTIRRKKPNFRKGLPYIVVGKFSKTLERALESCANDLLVPPQKFPIIRIFGVYFIKPPSKKIVRDKRKRKAFAEVILDHEVREEILERAEYDSKTAHKIVLEKEKKYLERKGLLKEYLEWLRQEYPEIYEGRIVAWKMAGQAELRRIRRSGAHHRGEA